MCVTKNSKPIASAHPMSLPSLFHPGMSRHACQYFPTVIAMPTPELASEYALMSMMGVGFGIGHEMVCCCRRAFHHLRSSVVCRGGVRGMKGQL
jgi:hypothetical protein